MVDSNRLVTVVVIEVVGLSEMGKSRNCRVLISRLSSPNRDMVNSSAPMLSRITLSTSAGTWSKVKVA